MLLSTELEASEDSQSNFVELFPNIPKFLEFRFKFLHQYHAQSSSSLKRKRVSNDKVSLIIFTLTKKPEWHCVKSIQIRSFFWSTFSPKTGKYGQEKAPYLETFHAV